MLKLAWNWSPLRNEVVRFAPDGRHRTFPAINTVDPKADK
jgi:hypothetical protein